MTLKRVSLRREAAAATITDYTRFAVQAARRLVRLQEKRRKLRRELRAVDDELKVVKRQMRDITAGTTAPADLDTPLPKVSNE